MTPTAPTPAFSIGEKTDDPVSMYLADIYTVTASLAGICGVSVPVRRVERRAADRRAGAGAAFRRGHGLPRRAWRLKAGVARSGAESNRAVPDFRVAA